MHMPRGFLLRVGSPNNLSYEYNLDGSLAKSALSERSRADLHTGRGWADHAVLNAVWNLGRHKIGHSAKR